jgi:glycogenin glucosyltransferase
MATLFDSNDLDNLVLKCPYEQEYPAPEKMVDSKGKRLYAYVTLVMLGDNYISGAIVLAKSIKDAGSNADLVVLITPDVSSEGKELLKAYFDKVIDINYIQVQNWRTKKQQHRKYLELVFTKFHLFNLTEYKKVLLIDADALVLKHPDHLFTLNAPAGCFLENKDLFISYDKEGNYILPTDGKIKWYDKYCDCCGHGKMISKRFTDRVAFDKKNSGIGGGLILLEPKVGELDDIIRDVSYGVMKKLVETSFVWPEQQYLTLRYSGKWTSINPRFFGLQGYPHWKVLYGLQYGGDKPFSLTAKFPQEIRVQYPDFILWHNYYEEILKENPDFKTNKVLTEVNEFHKLFTEKKQHGGKIYKLKNIDLL